jgi:hypothetical protein
VQCTATDTLNRSNSCSFTVTVSRTPQLSVTKFLAFGDSITAGEVTFPVTGIFPQRNGAASRKLVQIGAEEGRVIEPSAFDVAANGSFAVADAPNGRERIQLFDASGVRTGGFLLAGRGTTRIVLGLLALNGAGTLTFTGRTLVMSHPESGWLLTEYGLAGAPIRSVGQLRPTGHEADRDLRLAMNAGIPIPDPNGGFYFVFMAGPPAFRKYDAEGELVYERAIQGREIDPVVAAIPTRWPRRAAGGGEVPLVSPTIRTAAIDPAGRLWVSFVVPFTYVYDGDGEKSRTSSFAVRVSLLRPACHSVLADDCWSRRVATSLFRDNRPRYNRRFCRWGSSCSGERRRGL